MNDSIFSTLNSIVIVIVIVKKKKLEIKKKFTQIKNTNHTNILQKGFVAYMSCFQ